MLTVPDAARRVGKDPETIRRWIRSGRLRSQRVGTQHLVDEAELDALTASSQSLPLPSLLRTTWSGREMPDVVTILRDLRESR
jgi:excisionase family DNA binding protein